MDEEIIERLSKIEAVQNYIKVTEELSRIEKNNKELEEQIENAQREIDEYGGENSTFSRELVAEKKKKEEELSKGKEEEKASKSVINDLPTAIQGELINSINKDIEQTEEQANEILEEKNNLEKQEKEAIEVIEYRINGAKTNRYGIDNEEITRLEEEKTKIHNDYEQEKKKIDERFKSYSEKAKGLQIEKKKASNINLIQDLKRILPELQEKISAANEERRNRNKESMEKSANALRDAMERTMLGEEENDEERQVPAPEAQAPEQTMPRVATSGTAERPAPETPTEKTATPKEEKGYTVEEQFKNLFEGQNEMFNWETQSASGKTPEVETSTPEPEVRTSILGGTIPRTPEPEARTSILGGTIPRETTPEPEVRTSILGGTIPRETTPRTPEPEVRTSILGETIPREATGTDGIPVPEATQIQYFNVKRDKKGVTINGKFMSYEQIEKENKRLNNEGEIPDVILDFEARDGEDIELDEKITYAATAFHAKDPKFDLDGFLEEYEKLIKDDREEKTGKKTTKMDLTYDLRNKFIILKPSEREKFKELRENAYVARKYAELKMRGFTRLRIEHRAHKEYMNEKFGLLSEPSEARSKVEENRKRKRPHHRIRNTISWIRDGINKLMPYEYEEEEDLDKSLNGRPNVTGKNPEKLVTREASLTGRKSKDNDDLGDYGYGDLDDSEIASIEYWKNKTSNKPEQTEVTDEEFQQWYDKMKSKILNGQSPEDSGSKPNPSQHDIFTRSLNPEEYGDGSRPDTSSKYEDKKKDQNNKDNGQESKDIEIGE